MYTAIVSNIHMCVSNFFLTGWQRGKKIIFSNQNLEKKQHKENNNWPAKIGVDLQKKQIKHLWEEIPNFFFGTKSFFFSQENNIYFNLNEKLNV